MAFRCKLLLTDCRDVQSDKSVLSAAPNVN